MVWRAPCGGFVVGGGHQPADSLQLDDGGDDTGEDDLRTVLVTGGTGYIGSHTCLELLNTGRYRVVVIDNLIFGIKAIEINFLVILPNTR